MKRTISHNQQCVKDFHHAFSHPIADKFDAKIFKDNTLMEFRLSLINEEIKELTQAVKDHDDIEILDACADIMYVILGFCVVLGIELYDVARADAYLMHGCDNMTCTCEKHDMEIIGSIDKYYNELVVSVSESDIENVKCKFKNILYSVYRFSLKLNTDLDDVFNDVHESNMSKLCRNEDVAIKTVKFYDSDDRYDAEYKSFEDYFIVFDKNSGKILKSIEYHPVKIVLGQC